MKLSKRNWAFLWDTIKANNLPEVLESDKIIIFGPVKEGKYRITLQCKNTAGIAMGPGTGNDWHQEQDLKDPTLYSFTNTFSIFDNRTTWLGDLYLDFK